MSSEYTRKIIKKNCVCKVVKKNWSPGRGALVGSRGPRITYKPSSQRKEEWIHGNRDLFVCVCRSSYAYVCIHVCVSQSVIMCMGVNVCVRAWMYICVQYMIVYTYTWVYQCMWTYLLICFEYVWLSVHYYVWPVNDCLCVRTDKIVIIRKLNTWVCRL